MPGLVAHPIEELANGLKLVEHYLHFEENCRGSVMSAGKLVSFCDNIGNVRSASSLLEYFDDDCIWFNAFHVIDLRLVGYDNDDEMSAYQTWPTHWGLTQLRKRSPINLQLT